MFHDLPGLIEAVGLLGIFGIIFAETGLLIGFFLPGDSLLFTAGFLASQGFFGIWPLIIGSFIAAVIGDSVGYAIGRRAGETLFDRPDSRWFRREHVTRAKEFFARHGVKTIVLARFVPVIRTFAPVVAGVGQMHYSTFLVYNIVGGVLWAIGLPLAGYYLGNTIPDIDKYLLPAVAIIIILSVLPAGWEIWQAIRRKRR